MTKDKKQSQLDQDIKARLQAEQDAINKVPDKKKKSASSYTQLLVSIIVAALLLFGILFPLMNVL
jgi:F0F1-type ATP synthase assembly protein I